MTNPLKALIIDDSEGDTRLITSELQRGGFDLVFERVNSLETMKAALEQKSWDVVISNFVTSQCTALEAFAWLHEKDLDLPFIIVSDTMNEDIARQCLTAGIHVFFKKKNIKLLIPAVERGLREARLRREQKLTEELFKNLATNSPIGVYIVQKRRFVYVNSRFQEYSGYSEEELLEKEALSLVFPEDREKVRENAIAMLKGERVIPYEFRIINKKGEIKWALESVSSIPYQGRQATLSNYQDLTPQKLMEQKIKSSEEKYRSLYEEFVGILDAIPDNLSLIAPDLTIVWANKNLERSLGKGFPEIIGQHCYQIWHSRSEPCEVCPVQRSFTSKKTDFQERTTNQGKIFELHTVPITDEQGEVKTVVELARDITHLKKAAQEMASLHNQLRQAQKMEAIGRLAGGVAHDFNNLLTVIQVNTEMSLRELRKDDPLRSKLEEITQATERAANLTRQLLAFSRRQVFNLKVIDLNFILEDLGKMLRRIIGEEIELITSFADDLGMVKADPGEFEQVIINLAVNAKDAMPQGGTLTIATANVELDKEYVQRHLDVTPGSYIVVSVTDTGVGIPEEIREQIFDPFFTTKEKGKGTGLGLATAYGIVKQSGGDIQVYSEVGKGTTFKIYFPRADKTREEREHSKNSDILPRGKETILVVEDDSAVRKIAVKVLTSQGYNVLVAESGGDALLVCEQEKNPIHLVLTDVVMPKTSGPELIASLKKIRQGFKVIYMSGYTDKHILKSLNGELNFIQKPFNIDVLVKKVRDVLDTGQGSKGK